MTDDQTITQRDCIDIDARVHQLLGEQHKIAIIWCTDDVKNLRPDLSDEQAWEVLEQVRDIHDAEWGISWTTLQTVADDLFPKPKDSNEPSPDGRPL